MKLRKLNIFIFIILTITIHFHCSLPKAFLKDATGKNKENREILRGSGATLSEASKNAEDKADKLFDGIPYKKTNRECSKEQNLEGTYWLCILSVKKLKKR